MVNKIMLSIHHIHTERIFGNEKGLEIRKTAPSGTPFIAYMYETKSGGGAGAVVGQFKCRYITKIHAHILGTEEPTGKSAASLSEHIAERARLTVDELIEYANGGDIYGLDISDVIRYPTAMPLSFFGINRAPQSWQYVK